MHRCEKHNEQQQQQQQQQRQQQQQVRILNVHEQFHISLRVAGSASNSSSGYNIRAIISAARHTCIVLMISQNVSSVLSLRLLCSKSQGRPIQKYSP